MSYRLQIFDGGAEWSYQGERFERHDASLAEASTASVIEMSDATVRIDGAFLGTTDRFEVDVHEDGFRALLTFGNSTIVNGRIFRDTVTWDQRLRSWVIGVIASAPEDFERRMEQIPIDSNAIFQYIAGQAMWKEVATAFGEPDLVLAVDIEDLWEAIVAQEPGVDWSFSGDFVRYRVSYYDGETIRNLDRRPLLAVVGMREGLTGLPEWNALQYFQHLHAKLAWRVRISYEEFPSDVLIVQAFRDDWIEVGGLPALDDRIEAESWDHTEAPPEFPDLGGRYRAMPDEETPENERMPDAAFYGAFVPRMSETFQPRNRNLFSLNFTLPGIDDFAFFVSGYQPDPSGHPGYSEQVQLRQARFPDPDGVYLLPLQKENELDDDYMVVYDRLMDVVPAPGQEDPHNEVFPIAWLRNYDLSRRWTHVVTGRFDVAGLDIGVGDPQRGVSFLGRSWLVTEMEVEPRLNSAELTLVRAR